MKFDFHLLMSFVAIGLLTKKITWKGWLAIGAMIFAWILFNWKRGM